MPGQMATARLDSDVMISNIGPIAEIYMMRESMYVGQSVRERYTHVQTYAHTHMYVHRDKWQHQMTVM